MDDYKAITQQGIGFFRINSFFDFQSKNSKICLYSNHLDIKILLFLCVGWIG